MALAESETTTYMVAMKAVGDEFDALADELLVPGNHGLYAYRIGRPGNQAGAKAVGQDAVSREKLASRLPCPQIHTGGMSMRKT